jgi:hypothetical protein
MTRMAVSRRNLLATGACALVTLSLPELASQRIGRAELNERGDSAEVVRSLGE